MHILELSEDILLCIFSLLTPFHRDAWLASAPDFMEPYQGPTSNVDEPRDAYPLKGLNDLAFSQVCQLWRRAALGDPRLWAFADFWRPPVALEMLDRVGDAPVAIRWEETSPSSTQTLKHVEQRLSNVRMLQIEGSLVRSPLSDFLSGGSIPSPERLEALRIRVTARDSDRPSILPLHHFLLRSPGLFKMTRLELHLQRTTVQFDALLSVLGSLPGLVHLSLRNAFSNQVIPVSSSQGRSVIRLHDLHTLFLADIPQIFPMVFQVLELPSVCHVTLTHLFDDTNPDIDHWYAMEDSSPAQEELRSSSMMFGHLSVECRALSFRETCYEIVEEGVTFHAYATKRGQLSPEYNVLEVLDAHPNWNYLPLYLNEGIQLVLRNLSVTCVTYLEVYGMDVNQYESNPVYSNPPSAAEWVGILKAMPLLTSILVTEYPARELLGTLTNDGDGVLGIALHTLIISNAFLESYGCTPTSVILEAALRARERTGHAIPLVKLHRCRAQAPDVRAVEATASQWDLSTRIIRIDDEMIHFPRKA